MAYLNANSHVKLKFDMVDFNIFNLDDLEYVKFMETNDVQFMLMELKYPTHKKAYVLNMQEINEYINVFKKHNIKVYECRDFTFY